MSLRHVPVPPSARPDPPKPPVAPKPPRPLPPSPVGLVPFRRSDRLALAHIIGASRPTIESVTAAVGCSSKSTGHLIVRRLQAAGLVEIDPGRHGTLRTLVRLLPLPGG